MDLIAVAARVATGYASMAGKRAECGVNLSFEEVAGERVRTGPYQPTVVLATKKSSRKKSVRTSKPKKSVLRPETEYSVNVDLSLSADFEGTTSKNKLLKKFQSELFAAIKESVATTARELGLQSTGVMVKPIEVGVAVTDMTSSDDYEESEEY